MRQRLIVDLVRSVLGLNKSREWQRVSSVGCKTRYHGCMDEEWRKKEQQAVDLKKKGPHR